MSPTSTTPSSLPSTSLLTVPHLSLSHLSPLPLHLCLSTQDDVVEVYLDYGDVHIPDTLQLPSLPRGVLEPVQWALSRVLDPGMGHRDSVFGRPLPNKPKSLELQVRMLTVRLPSLQAEFLWQPLALMYGSSHAWTKNRKGTNNRKQDGTWRQDRAYDGSQMNDVF